MTGEIMAFSSERRAMPVSARAAYGQTQRALARFNHERVAPGLGEEPSPGTLLTQRRMETVEALFIERSRVEIGALVRNVPKDSDGFIDWFEGLKEQGPGQGDPLFPWLAEQATHAQLCWFLAQEVAGEAGFDDLVAMTQVKMPTRAKLEMARNYWDEMGRGGAKGMHGPMLDRLAQFLGLEVSIDNTVAEALALGNTMMAFALNRRYAFHAVGALGVIEMTAPSRSAYVSLALDRLGIPKKQSHYFALHAVLDVKHSEAWNREVLRPLVSEDPRRAQAIAEGAVLRLWCGQRCFNRYRQHLMGTGQVGAGRGH